MDAKVRLCFCCWEIANNAFSGWNVFFFNHGFSLTCQDTILTWLVTEPLLVRQRLLELCFVSLLTL